MIHHDVGLGLECYITAMKNVLRGKLKQRASDFIVTELDVNGQFVTLECCRNQIKTTADTCTKIKPQNVQDDNLSGGKSTNELEGDSQLTQCETTGPHLKQLISEDVYKKLVTLADSCFVNASSEAVQQSVNLGLVKEKVVRTNIHRAIRDVFPQLSSSTIHTSNITEHEIHVTVDSNYHCLSSLLGHDETCKLLRFLNIGKRSGCGLFLKPDPCKKHRTEVHRALGELYGHMIVTHAHTSLTTPPPSKRRKEQNVTCPQINVQFRLRKRKCKRIDKEEDEIFTKFALRKENIETLEAVEILSHAMNCQPSQFSYAGSKDSRAITTQYMTVRGITPFQLSSLGPLPQNISIGNIQSVSEHIHLGEHGGNHFNIRIKDITITESPLDPKTSLEEVVREFVKSVEEKGVINYFGPQRFGYTSHNPQSTLSHQIGLAMLQGNCVQAVDLLLSPCGDTKDTVQEAKQYFTTTKDAAGTLKLMPYHMTRERLVLKALNCHGYSEYGCIRALCNLPYNTRLLYIHSYSSLIWNYLASFRIKEYGLKPAEGDLVLKTDKKYPTLRDAVYMLTSADIDSGLYSVRDIVLPTVGTATILPGNKVADRLTSLLSDVGLTLKSFRLRQLRMSSSGAYRHLLQFPKHIQWRITRNRREKSDEVLVKCERYGGKKSDIETRGSVCGKEGRSEGDEDEKGEGSDRDQGSEDNSSRRTRRDDHCQSESEEARCDTDNLAMNLELQFCVPPSCYATVVLRELLGSGIL